VFRSCLLLSWSWWCCGILAAVEPDTWPGKRGPTDDWTAPAHANFPGTGARELWRAQVGTGSSGIAIGQGVAITLGNAADTDTIRCLEAGSGKERWAVAYPSRCEPRGYEGGPNATPCLLGDRVYSLSRQGLLLCLALADGRQIWRRDLLTDGVRQPNYGFSCAPVISHGMLLLNVGTHGRAYSCEDGRPLWNSGDRADGYSTVTIGLAGGGPAVFTFTRTAVSAANLADGRLLWSFPWPVKHAVADPLLLGERVLVTHGYGSGTIVLGREDGVREAGFPTDAFLGVLYPPVHIDGHLYGSTGDKQTAGEFRCIRSQDGAIIWSDTTLGTGSCVAVGRHLVFLGRRGLLAVLDASPAGLREHWRMQALPATCWTIPSVAGGRIYVRDADGLLLCLEPIQGQ
jgi:outer membrane protein assembly factor BamB